MATSIRLARPGEAQFELNEFRLHIEQVTGITRIEYPQAAPMKSCELLTGYIFEVVAEPLVKGDVWSAAIDGGGTRRGSQETKSQGSEHRVFQVRRSHVACPGPSYAP
jgi:hypothetical protein